MERAIKSVLAGSILALLMGWPMVVSAQSSRAGFKNAPTIDRNISPSRTVRIVGTPLNPNFAPIHTVPGLGFDYAHLAIVNPSEHGRSGREAPRFLGSGLGEILPLNYFPGSVPFYSQPQPTVIVLEQPPQTLVVQTPSSAAQVPPPNPAPPATVPDASAASLQELGQFILVRREGKIEMAVGFTIRGNQVIYVTREGVRLSFPLSDLDVEATLQMNNVNGTTLTLPK